MFPVIVAFQSSPPQHSITLNETLYRIFHQLLPRPHITSQMRRYVTPFDHTKLKLSSKGSHKNTFLQLPFVSVAGYSPTTTQLLSERWTTAQTGVGNMNNGNLEQFIYSHSYPPCHHTLHEWRRGI